MADIIVTCAECGHDHRVSEYVQPEDMQCVKCKGRLVVPEQKAESSLKLRGPGAAPAVEATPSEPPPIEGGAPLPPPVPKNDTEDMRTDLEEVYQAREPEKKTHAVWSWLAFLVLAGTMVWMQMGIREDPHMLTTYNWVRGVAGAFIYLLVVVVAFEDHLWQGLLSLLIVPYSMYYALVRLDSRMLRNLFLALMVGFGAEMYFIPDHAFVVQVQQEVNSVIYSGEGAIQRAGDAPTFN